MATDQPALPALAGGQSRDLAAQWRRFGRAATVVALLTSPALFLFFHEVDGWSVGWSLLVTVGCVAAVRGVVDLVMRRLVPWPTLFGTEDARAMQDDVVNRRRSWFWRRLVRTVVFLAAVITVVWFFKVITAAPGESVSWWGLVGSFFHVIGTALRSSTFWIQLLFVVFLFLANFLIFMGPLMLMGIMQIRAYEPGDADWGVRLEDVRGQAEAKEEVRRVVTLWQSGEQFEAAGGKRERGLLMLGAPGTGKTMLSKAIATGFNCPFVSIPGSGFAQTFIGMDAVIVRWLAWRARRLARKWGGQCIVFIDEIDAVGMRRASLGTGGPSGHEPSDFHELCFFGPNGALTPTGDLVLETRVWRERLFASRAPSAPVRGYVAAAQRVDGVVRQVFPGGMFGGGGQLALNQLLVVMDGIGNAPFGRRLITNLTNSLLDASYVIPQKIGRMRLRLPKPRPSSEQIYFIGACNVPIEALDPALTRPGRMGRHVWFRTPTKQDRIDIFDLYLAKVAHEPDLDGERRREELARITNGYSPAMIEQVCSMALTIAHHDARMRFGWGDIVEAMTTVESGTAVNIEYVPEETRAVAIHEAGHAVASHVYMKGAESTRISIRKRGGSLGHHQALEKEERFSTWRHEEMGRLVWTLGAMAAERVFYGENSTGVGGDVMSATARAAWMVGACAMAPERVDLGDGFASGDEEDDARAQIGRRFERIGVQIMRRAGGGGPFEHDPIAGVLGDREKRSMAAQLLGQAYVTAHNLVAANRDGVERVADVLVERRELHGDEVLELLASVELHEPRIDLLTESAWPRL